MTKYHIMRAECGNAESIFETTNKAQAERYFRRLYETYFNTKEWSVYFVNERNFVIDDDSCGQLEYWIEKF